MHFFVCKVSNEAELQSNDDAEEALWINLDDIHTEEFWLALHSSRTVYILRKRKKIRPIASFRQFVYG